MATETSTSADELASRIALLEEEIRADPEAKERHAILRWELGRLAEEAGLGPSAIKSYLASYNLSPEFRTPLFALLRIFERRRSHKNLSRLYDAERKSAVTNIDRGAALIDKAGFVETREGNVDEAIAYLNEALDLLDHAPSSTKAAAALLAERLGRRESDGELIARALESQIESTPNATWRVLLLLDLAAAYESQNDVERALETLDRALEVGTAKFRALEALERFGRRTNSLDQVARALEGQAELAEVAARGNDPDAGSGAFSIKSFANSQRAGNRATALLYEAAACRTRAGNPTRAGELLDRALKLRPADALLLEARLHAAAEADDHVRVAALAAAAADEDAPATRVAAMMMRAAQASLAGGDIDAAIDQLVRGLTACPASVVLELQLEDLLKQTGRLEELVLHLEERAQAEEGDGDARAMLLWRAATVAADEVGDFDKARNHYEGAAAAASDPTEILRDFLNAAWRHGQLDAARTAMDALLKREVDDSERSALLRDRFMLAETAEDSDQALSAGLNHSAAHPWALDAARIRGADHKSFELLARAHRILAERSGEPDRKAAHLAVAGRAYIRAEMEDEAVAVLRAALAENPGHRYAVALLEEQLRKRGNMDEVVALLRRAAEAQEGPRAAMVRLLLAGAAAEASGDDAVAAQTYEQAADHDPDSVSPLWALRRLALRTRNADLLLRVQEGLSERELQTSEGGHATLELAEHYAFVVGQATLAERPLSAALERATVGLEAAATLVSLPDHEIDPSLRIQALETLLAASSGGDALVLGRLLGSVAETDGLDVERADAIAATLRADEATAADMWANLRALRSSATGGDAEARAEAWISLCNATSDPIASAHLMLHGLRAKLVGVGNDAADDAFLLAQELAEAADEGEQGQKVIAAIAADEMLEAGDDAEVRADTLLARLEHSSTATRRGLEAAAGRALTAARRPQEALDVLKAVVASEPGDLASWEALRLAARQVPAWDDVVQACDRLATVAQGDDRNELLEEAGAVLMDHLGSPAEAEKRLQQVVRADRSRPNAYHRLHDLIAARDDAPALLELVSQRIGSVHDSSELERLFYEQARLLRAAGELDKALVAIENLRMLDDEHVGGIALAVEINVSRQNWADAVEGLRDIAASPVPISQKRISRLGAADFLQKRLNDPRGALQELTEIDKLGLADLAIHKRMAALAEEVGDLASAARAYEQAAVASRGDERAALSRKAGELLRTNVKDDAAALTAFRRAFEQAPHDFASAQAIAELLEGDAARRNHAERFEQALRGRLDRQPLELDDLRSFAAIGVWKKSSWLEAAALEALSAMAAATPAEETRLNALRGVLRGTPQRSPLRDESEGATSAGRRRSRRKAHCSTA